MNETKNPKRYAEIRQFKTVGNQVKYSVHVYSRQLEGHYACISHAPFSKVPTFDTIVQADDFANSFGVATLDIHLFIEH